MAQNAKNVRVAGDGSVAFGPLTASGPTGITGPLPGFIDVGYLSEDGSTEERDRDTESIKAWQRGVNVRTIVTEGTLTYQFQMIETNEGSIELFYGTKPVSGSYEIVPTETGGRRQFVFTYLDGDEVERIWIPEGEATKVGEVERKNDEAKAYEVTVTAYPSDQLEKAGAVAKVWHQNIPAATVPPEVAAPAAVSPDTTSGTA